MGLLINGQWENTTDNEIKRGAFVRTKVTFGAAIDQTTQSRLLDAPDAFALIASPSCPWSHAATLTWVLKGLSDKITYQRAIGPRVQGYALDPTGPVAQSLGAAYAHQLYTATRSDYTGRVTVPILWDIPEQRIICNESTHIIKALDAFGEGPKLCPDNAAPALSVYLSKIYDGLSNAVYRAGLAQRQDVYDTAVDQVFETMADLDRHFSDRRFLLGESLTVADLRLFATLVRFDTVYVTHFRCTRHRLTEFENLWLHTRRIYNMPGVADTVDFDEIMRGYFLNDGDHNPRGIVSQPPAIDWSLP